MFALPLFHSPACLHPSCCHPLPFPPLVTPQSPPAPNSPATTLVFPKSSAIRHLQWINYTVLTWLDWASNICTPPPQTPDAPFSPPPTYIDLGRFLLHSFLSLVYASLLSSPLLSSKPLPSTPDPKLDFLVSKMTTALPPRSSLGWGASLIGHRFAGSSPWSLWNIGITLIEELT